MKKLPIGIQSFQEARGSNLTKSLYWYGELEKNIRAMSRVSS